MFEKVIQNVILKAPLVHLITNYVTVNDCANVVLAAGGSPIMADAFSEVLDIVAICKSLVINIGTLNERTIKSMLIAGKHANELKHPVILDPVGAGASKLRNDCISKLLKEVKFSVIRGNISEIRAVAFRSGQTKGVDANEIDLITDQNINTTIDFAKNLSKKTGAIVAISGAIDVVANSDKAYIIKNGHPVMTKISGCGCMLTALIGAYCGANYENLLEATAASVLIFALCGEQAHKSDIGTYSFRTSLVDNLSKIHEKSLNGGLEIEVR